MEKTQESLTKIKAYLETSPDLNSYDYQEWNQATEDFVNSVIRNTVPGGRMIESVESSNRKQSTSAPVVEDEFVLPSAPQKPAAPAPAVETNTSTSALDNLDDFDSNTFDDELYASL